MIGLISAKVDSELSQIPITTDGLIGQKAVIAHLCLSVLLFDIILLLINKVHVVDLKTKGMMPVEAIAGQGSVTASRRLSLVGTRRTVGQADDRLLALIRMSQPLLICASSSDQSMECLATFPPPFYIARYGTS